MRGKRRSGFVAVEPCGYAEAVIGGLRISLAHCHGAREPLLIGKSRRTLQHSYGICELGIGASCHPRAQVCRFHSAGTASAHHGVAFLGEAFAQQCHLGIHLIATQRAVAAHHAHYAHHVVLCHKAVERHLYVVIV